MPTPAELVSDMFATAEIYIDNATSQVETFAAALAGAVSVVPLVEVEWEALPGPSAAPVPSRPAALEELEGEFDWDADGSIEAAKPDELTAEAPNLTIDTFDEPDPEVDFGTPPVLSFDEAPVVTIGTAPTVPEIEDITVPEPPEIELPDTPTYLSLSTPTFAGVDLNPEFLERLEEVPTLDLVAPTPYSYTPNPEYSSALMTALQEGLLTRLAGGTGLDAAVEEAIWDRARDRESALAQDTIDDVQRNAEELGFHLPTGVLASQLRRAQRNYHDKVSGLSRDIAIKQAELEQENLKTSVAQAIELEGRLIEYSWKMENLAFEHAKAVAQNAIDIYNAQVANFQVTVSAYNAYAQAYRAIIDGELAKVEVFKAEIQAELAKAETNRTLVQQYEAEVRARLATVELYNAQVEGAKARMQLETAKLAAVGEEIKAYIAGINGETAKVEAYKVGVQAQAIQVDAYAKGIEAQLASVKVYEAKADAFKARVGAQAEYSRAQISYYNGQVEAYKAQWSGWSARVSAESERIRALGIKSNSTLDGYRADIARYEAIISQDIKHWETSIRQYDAQKNYVLTAEKLNTEIVRANNNALLEAAKVGAQVHAQLASAAHSSIQATAQVQASANNQVQYQYQNQTATSPPAVTAV